MNILGCLDRPSGGSYQLDGKEVAQLSDDELAETRNKKIGFVFQNFNLLARMSSLQNVALPMTYAGVGKKQRLESARNAMEQVGLADRMNHLPTELSGGQRQRVAIARALVNQPAILLADEPTGNLDDQTASSVIDLFGDLARRGKTILMVTHDMDLARRSSRIVTMSAGHIVSSAVVGGPEA